MHRKIPEQNAVCVQREGFHATAITGVVVAGNIFFAVETWQRKLPLHSPTCLLRLLDGEGAGCSPARPAPPAEWGALFPNTAVPYLICSPAPSDTQWGDLSKKK